MTRMNIEFTFDSQNKATEFAESAVKELAQDEGPATGTTVKVRDLAVHLGNVYHRELEFWVAKAYRADVIAHSVSKRLGTEWKPQRG